MRSADTARSVVVRARAFPGERPLLATLLCALLAFSFPLFVFHEVVFGHKSLSTSLLTPGVNGFQSPPGEHVTGLPASSQYRIDPGASAWQTEPWAELTSRFHDDGEQPLWNPHQGAGTPFAANTISATFDPLLVLVNEHPTPLTWDISILFAFCLGSAAMFAFLRSLALRRLACLVGAAAFSVGGYFALYSNNPFARGYIYLPILFLLVDRVLASPGPPWAIALGVGLGGAVLVGMPEVSVFVIGTAALYAVYRLITGCESDERLAALGRLGAASLLGLALAAPVLLIFVQYESLSFNAHQAGSSAGTGSDPLRMLFYWAVPYVNGQPLFGINPPGTFSGTRAWIGAGAIASAALCITAPFRFVMDRRGPFFGGLAAIALWKIYGLPGSDIIGELPVLERFSFNAYLPAIFGFALAALAAIGVDALLRGQIAARRLLVVTVLVAIAGALGLRSSRPALAFATGDYTLKWVGLAVVAAATVLLVAWVLVVRPSWRVPLGCIAAVVIFAELFVLFPRHIYQDRADPYRTPAWQSTVERTQPPGPKVARTFGLDAKLFPDTATAMGLYDIRDLDALYIDRYIDYVREFVSPTLVDRFTGGPYYGHEGLPLYSENPMFDLFGVRYVLSNAKQLTDPASLVEYVDRAPGRPPFQRTKVAVGKAEARDAAVARNGQEFVAPVPTGDAAPASVHLSFAAAPPKLGAEPDPAPVTFVVEGVAADGSRIPLFRADQPAAARGDVWQDADVNLRGVPIESVAFRVETGGRGKGAWSRVHYVDAEGRKLGPQFRQLVHTRGADVYENLHVMPRAFVVHDVTTVADKRGARRYLEEQGTPAGTGTFLKGFDPQSHAVVEATGADVPRDTASCPTSPSESATITKYEPLEVHVRVDADCVGLLFLSDADYPGWKATVNGHDAPVLPTDYLFRGVRVPEGRSTVVFTFESPRFDAGVWVARLATLVALVWLLVWVLRKRRRDAAAA